MSKVVTLCSAKPGFDIEETYQLWYKNHRPYAKKYLSPELRKYRFSTVIRTLPVEFDKTIGSGGGVEDINLGFQNSTLMT